jgi:Mn-dependent DtxR family transcriptional regulator
MPIQAGFDGICKEGARLRGTVSREDYLEAIFLLSQRSKREDGSIRAAAVAEHMSYSATATHKAMLRLEKDNFIRFGKSKLIYLTDEGYKLAATIYEKHVFFREMLVHLGMDREIAERAACEMEHGVNDEVFALFKKLWSEYLEKPCGRFGFCPREYPNKTT